MCEVALLANSLLKSGMKPEFISAVKVALQSISSLMLRICRSSILELSKRLIGGIESINKSGRDTECYQVREGQHLLFVSTVTQILLLAMQAFTMSINIWPIQVKAKQSKVYSRGCVSHLANNCLLAGVKVLHIDIVDSLVDLF